MSLLQLQNTLRSTVVETAKSAFNIELEQAAAEIPPKTELGDLAFPVAFELAKKIKQVTGEKRNPREIAETLKAALETNESVERVEVAGAGYLNVFYNRAKFLAEIVEGGNPRVSNGANTDSQSAITKVCVEHTSVNPNKAAHIGHVRNSVLGDTFVRILRANGKEVEVQNYIDNTGVQVADVVVGFIYLEKMNLEDIKKLDKDLTRTKNFRLLLLGFVCASRSEYQKDEELKSKRAEVLHAVEEGDNETAKLADYVATRNVECNLTTMERLSIRYDLLPRESECLYLISGRKPLKNETARYDHFETEGKSAGCWVMPTESHTGDGEHESDKILVRSNGTVTYTGKDIAYQMWKFGLLGLDFYYKLFHTYDDGKEVWITSATDSQSEKVPAFGSNETVYNVIDSRQSYPQEVVKKGVAVIFPEKAKRRAFIFLTKWSRFHQQRRKNWAL
jgi:arginyl-tRNA synthetase